MKVKTNMTKKLENNPSVKIRGTNYYTKGASSEAPNAATNLKHNDKGLWTIDIPEGVQLRDTMEEAYEDEIKRLKAEVALATSQLLRS